MEEIIDKLRKFNRERDWEQYHTPENLAKSVIIEAAELLENFQWSQGYDIQAVREEIADVLLYTLQLVDVLGLDFREICLEKIEKNGKKYPVEKCAGSAKKYSQLT
ncbi:nucleotide pyrophosphohydrolase [Guggenheimella bovis]